MQRTRVLCCRHLPEAQFVDISSILGAKSVVVL